MTSSLWSDTLIQTESYRYDLVAINTFLCLACFECLSLAAFWQKIFSWVRVSVRVCVVFVSKGI